jgi:uncharacterized cupredoxin-like copper-binding protein
MKAAFSGLVFASVLMLGSAQAQTAVTVSMTNYAFAPSTLTLKAGETYRIHFSNDSSKGHDFSAREFFQAATVAAADKGKLEDGDEVELDGGQSADITLTPNRAGTYPVTCTHFMHSMLGMTGQIVVQ